MNGLLAALGDPPSYRTPPVRPGHTRHYLPDMDHRKGKTGHTDLTLDPFLWLPRGIGSGAVQSDSELLVQWLADLTSEQRAVLGKLAELLPYLGRAESVCEARLLDDDPVPDEAWWRPGADGARTTRLLAPTAPLRREALEVGTVQVRKMRRTQPPGTVWVSYGAAGQEPSAAAQRSRTLQVNAVRFAIVSRVPVKLTHGVLLADAVHAAATRIFPDDVSGHVLGYEGARTDHAHAHWIPLPDPAEGDGHVQSLLVYVPAGLSHDDVSRLMRIRRASGRVGSAEGNGGGYEFRDLPRAALLLQAAGQVRQVAPELCGPALRWRSLTPYLPVRHWHRKREPLAGYVSADVSAELAYRDLPPAVVREADPDGGLPDNWARKFRRYRMKENLGRSRPGLGLMLEFAEPVSGPLLLGQLSHFGHGIFVPEQE